MDAYRQEYTSLHSRPIGHILIAMDTTEVLEPAPQSPRFFWWKSETGQIMKAWRRSPGELDVTPLAPPLTYEQLVDKVNVEEARSQGWAKVSHPDGSRDAYLFLRLTSKYDVMDQYRVARTQNRASGTAHGRFWKIIPGDVGMAAQFWQHFGPLEHQPVPNEIDDPDAGWVWFSLADFWRKHRRYTCVTRLWMTFDDSQELRRSWLELYAHLEAINKAEFFPLGKRPKGARRSEGLWSYSELPWEDPDVSFEEWLHTAEDAKLREVTADLLQLELRAQLREAPRWIRDGAQGRPKFEPVLVSGLWTAMWHLFALDTQSRGWRICPHCGKLFYPPREDRRYCTSKLQVYYSKQRWWEKHKQEELAKRRGERRRQRKLESDIPRG
jgi:hypothetical protein